VTVPIQNLGMQPVPRLLLDGLCVRMATVTLASAVELDVRGTSRAQRRR